MIILSSRTVDFLENIELQLATRSRRGDNNEKEQEVIDNVLCYLKDKLFINEILSNRNE